jgi:hypothetical protein
MRARECPLYSGDRFLAGFPNHFAQETWFAVDRVLPFEWMFEMLGASLAALVAGWLYKDGRSFQRMTPATIGNWKSAIDSAYLTASTNTAVP